MGIVWWILDWQLKPSSVLHSLGRPLDFFFLFYSLWINVKGFDSHPQTKAESKLGKGARMGVLMFLWGCVLCDYFSFLLLSGIIGVRPPW